MTPVFYVAHTAAGRTRIRWAGDSAKKNIVVELANDIANVAGVVDAEPRTVTGSIVIGHDGQDWPVLQSRIRDQLSIHISTTPIDIERDGAQTVNDSIDTIDHALKRVNMNFDSLLMLTLCALAILQALRGQVMSSSVSFLWYAFTLASIIRDRDNRVHDDETTDHA
jgi:hypothetical protein